MNTQMILGRQNKDENINAHWILLEYMIKYQHKKMKINRRQIVQAIETFVSDDENIIIVINEILQPNDVNVGDTKPKQRRQPFLCVVVCFSYTIATYKL